MEEHCYCSGLQWILTTLASRLWSPVVVRTLVKIQPRLLAKVFLICIRYSFRRCLPVLHWAYGSDALYLILLIFAGLCSLPLMVDGLRLVWY